MELNYQIPAATVAVQQNIKRKPTVAAAVASINRKVDQRVNDLATDISLGNVIKSRLVLVNQSLTSLLDLLYEIDESGHPVNVDPVTGRILIPLPWGADGWKRWKLRNHEGRVFRKLLDRRMRAGERVAMFVYDGESNRWHLNRRYGSKEAATQYLKNNPVTVTEWRLAHNSLYAQKK